MQAERANKNGQHIEAKKVYEEILNVYPKNSQARKGILGLGKISSNDTIQKNLTKEQINSVIALYNNGKFQEAVDSIKALNKDHPNVPLLFNLLGACHKSLGQIDAALQMLETATKIKPDYAEAYFNQGVILKGIGRLEEAVELYKKAISLNPNYPDAHNNLGNTFKDLGMYDEAIENIKIALSLSPKNANFFNNLGIIYKDKGSLKNAINSFNEATILEPKFYEAHKNSAITLRKLKRFNEALESYQILEDLRPDDGFNMTNIFHLKMMLCIWSDLPNQLSNLSNKINNNKKVIRPFALMSLIDDPELQKKATKIFSDHKFPKNNELSDIKNHPNNAKIRIGYFSSDFRDHPVSNLMAELFELHDRSQFEIYAFSFGPNTKDHTNLRIKKGVDFFHNVTSFSDKEIAILARSLSIDIAIDLGGYTQNSRTGIFAMTVAPVQINYLGYLNTMGASYYDYLIADTLMIPEETKYCYTEKIAYLPTFQVNDSTQQIPGISFTRKDLGLPDSGFVFCCFNNTYKFNPEVFDCWARILDKVQNSVLFIFADNELTRVNLTNEIVKRGIDAERLIFGKKLNRPEYLARFKVADLFLDTHPYNAGATASDALRMGLPILTMLGKSYQSRMGASILRAINLSELISHSFDSYESIAIELGNNTKKYNLIKEKLIKNKNIAPLYNSRLFSKNLESAYKVMIERYKKGLKSDHIYL